jgi:hypothetical protein
MGDDDAAAIAIIQLFVDAPGKRESQGQIKGVASDVAELFDVELNAWERVMQHCPQLQPANAGDNVAGVPLASRGDGPAGRYQPDFFHPTFLSVARSLMDIPV